MATLYTKKRYVPKFWRNKRIYQADESVRVQTIQGTGAAPLGVSYTAGDGLSLATTEFNVVPDNTTVEINGSSQVAVKDSGIDTTQLADYAVTNVKINPLAVDGGKLAAGAVSTAKIANDNVTVDKIQNFIFSGGISRDSTQNQSSGTAWTLVSNRSINSGRSEIGDKVICEAILSVTGADCFGGMNAYFDGTEDLHSATAPAFQTDELTSGVDMVVMKLEVWMISSTKVAYSFAYKEDELDGWKGHISGVQTLASSNVGDSFNCGMYCRDTSGSDSCTFEFGTIIIFRDCATG